MFSILKYLKRESELNKPIYKFNIKWAKKANKLSCIFNKVEQIVLQPKHNSSEVEKKYRYSLKSDRTKAIHVQNFYYTGNYQTPRIGEIVYFKGWRLLVKNVIHYMSNTTIEPYVIELDVEQLSTEQYVNIRKNYFNK